MNEGFGNQPYLDRCPFCGGDPELKEHFGDWSVKCKDCDCGTPWFEFISEGRKKAIELWNRRA